MEDTFAVVGVGASAGGLAALTSLVSALPGKENFAPIVVQHLDRRYESQMAPLLRIFDMFVQGDNSLEGSHAGLGVGLTLVRNLVELHGGTVDVRSDGLGTGTEFVVMLPIDPDALDTQAAVGCVAVHGREYLAAIVRRDAALMMYTLRTEGEVRQAGDVAELKLAGATVKAAELEPRQNLRACCAILLLARSAKQVRA